MPAFEYRTTIIDVRELEFFTLTAVQENIPVLGCEFFIGFINIKTVVLGERGQEMKIINVAAIPATDCACCEACFRVGDHTRLVKKLVHAQAIATFTGACGVVEREKLGF